jgi:hypothetical protein
MPQFGTIAFDEDGVGGEWNSGEVVTVSIFDPDMNYDTRSEDGLFVKDSTSIVPAIKIGDPITLKTLSTLDRHGGSTSNGAKVVIDTALTGQCSSDYDSSSTTSSYVSCYEKYSERSIVTVTNELAAMTAGETLAFTHSSDTTVKTLVD